MTSLLCNWDTAKILIFSNNVFGPLVYYSHFFALISSFTIGLFIFLKDKKSLLSQILFFITTIFSVWVFCDLVLWANEKPDFIMFFWSLQVIIEPLMYAACVYFIDVFIEKKDGTLKKKIIIGLFMLPIFILAATKFALVGFNLTNCDREVVEGPVALYGYFIEIFYTLWIVFFAFRKYWRAGVEDRKQIRLITIGIVLFLAAFSFGNIIGSFTDNWTVGQIGLFGMPIFVAFLSYLIVRFKTFNIKLLGTQVLVLALGFLVLAIAFIRNIENVKLVVAFTLLFVLLLGRSLIRSVKREVEQKERLQNLSINLERSNLNLADANDKLKGLDKLKNEFLSLASHQLRSPLTAIKGYASMLSEGSFGTLDEKQDGAVKRIYASAQGLVSVVEDLLNVSKIEQGGMKYEFMPTGLSAMIAQLVGEMKIPAENKQLEFTADIPSYDTCMVSADPVKIKQVFLNLVDNSIKYTQSGFVHIKLARDESTNTIVFSVHDSGVGISPETKAKLFEKFSRGEGGKLNTGGSGLGLYLAREIARAHKGDVVIDSEGLGKGATFSVTLPAVGERVK